jgi:DNA gyrase subunit A
LYKYTRLQDSFSVNFLALVKGKPKILGLRYVLQNYVEYRKNIITKRVKFDLNKAELRQEIVDGLLKAIDNLDEVIEIIRHSENPSEKLAKKFKFTENQVRAILETKLRQLTSMEQNKLKDEHSDLESKINEFKKILGDMGEILKIIKKEVLELKEKYGDPRRTQVLKRTIGDISEKDLVQEKEL